MGLKQWYWYRFKYSGVLRRSDWSIGMAQHPSRLEFSSSFIRIYLLPHFNYTSRQHIQLSLLPRCMTLKQCTNNYHSFFMSEISRFQTMTRKTGYPGRNVSRFSSFLPGNSGIFLQIRPRTLLSTYSSINE